MKQESRNQTPESEDRESEKAGHGNGFNQSVIEVLVTHSGVAMDLPPEVHTLL